MKNIYNYIRNINLGVHNIYVSVDKGICGIVFSKAQFMYSYVVDRREVMLHCVVILLFSVITLSCNNRFRDVNKDPSKIDKVDVGHQLVYVLTMTGEDRYSEWRGNLIHGECFVQHLSTVTVNFAGDRYITNSDYQSALWEHRYTPVISNCEDLLLNCVDKPNKVNFQSAARIAMVFNYQILTDFYGDIPYRRYLDPYPKYDSQQDIYFDMINELKESKLLFSESAQNMAEFDIMFNGDIEKWRRFANSLLMRLSMRISKIAPQVARKVFIEAFNDGCMLDHKDIPYTLRTGVFEGTNGVSEVFNEWGLSGSGLRISKTFMDILLDTENDRANIDPRVNILTAICNKDGKEINRNIDDYRGLPNGLSENEIGDLGGLYTFNCPNYNYMVRRTAPIVWMHNAEVDFLVAEACLKGWISEDAQYYFEKGVKSAFHMLTEVYGASAFDNHKLSSYVATLGDVSLKNIAIQKWISLFLNGYEAWAEWRRTGYPELTPVNYPGNDSNGQIPRKIPYPVEERRLNNENLQKAIKSQGGTDTFLTRVWWDVP